MTTSIQNRNKSNLMHSFNTQNLFRKQVSILFESQITSLANRCVKSQSNHKLFPPLKIYCLLMKSSFYYFVDPEIKDSCDFVEISQFGYCIGKTFVQMIKIIKWFLKSWLKDTKRFEKVKTNINSDIKEAQDGFVPKDICIFCEQLLKTTPCSKQTRQKRKGVAISDKTEIQIHLAQKNIRKEKGHLMDVKQQVLERYVTIDETQTLKQIESKRIINDHNFEPDILNRKHIAMKMDISNNQNVLEEVLNQFNMKTEAMARFVSTSQANFIENIQMNHQFDFLRFQEQMKQLINIRCNEAKEKIKAIISQKISDNEKQRRDRFQHKEVQTTNEQQHLERDKNEIKIRQLASTIKKLKNQLQYEKMLSESLKKLLQSKSIEFEEQFLNYRKDIIINGQFKSKTYLKSLKSFTDVLQESIEKESSIKFVDNDSEIKNVKVINRKIGSGVLNKEKSEKKKRYSIKFTLDGHQGSFQSLSKIPQSKKESAEVSVQTSLVQIVDEATSHIQPRISHAKKKSIFPPSIDKPQKIPSEISKRAKIKKLQTSPYDHIKSKIFIQKDNIKLIRNDFKQTMSSCMGNLVKKLSVDYLFSKQIQEQPIKCYKIADQPIFAIVSSIYITKMDIYDLFVNDKNAQTYECLMYRNSMFNLANINQKRLINLSAKLQTSDVDWTYKKQFSANNVVQNKIFSAFHNQFVMLKKKERPVYQQIKHLMRAPFQKLQNIDIFQLQSIHQKQRQSKDIQVGQLKKMINIIFKFHLDCISQHKDSICQHLVNFSNKIGIKLC